MPLFFLATGKDRGDSPCGSKEGGGGGGELGGGFKDGEGENESLSESKGEGRQPRFWTAGSYAKGRLVAMRRQAAQILVAMRRQAGR